MEKNIWRRCKGIDHLVLLSNSVWRIIDSQNIVATRKLVDSLEEQDILEELIESSKPVLKQNLTDLHPFLYTPFRYPPLQCGSRFGSRFEPSLWYGSLELNTAMAETAYYRFHFLRASQAEYGNVVTDHTAFSTQIKTKRGIDLTRSPFSEYTSIISSPASYEVSQQLGNEMRQENVEAFHYHSARDPNKGINIALLTPETFLHKRPQASSFQSWKCIVNEKVAEFVRLSAINIESRSFLRDIFLSNGELPFPAV